MAVRSLMVELGTPAPPFTLRTVDGELLSIADLDEAPVLVVAFVCNHCPYVRHVEDELGRIAAEYSARGVAFVGICPSDAQQYPDDAPEHLAEQAERAGWTFPYLVDEDQQVTAAYQAACTPDVFVYDGDRRLVYRGAIDESSPGREQVPVTGELLRQALDHALRDEEVPGPHVPSMGCSIKWKPGNEPDEG